MNKRFHGMLISLCDREMDDQKELIQQEFESWRQDQEQTDDVLVMRVKIAD